MANSTHSLGATVYPNVTTLQDCQALCQTMMTAQPPCLGLDWNTVEGSCWLHTDSTQYATKLNGEGIDQYTPVVTCSPANQQTNNISTGCPSQWTIIQGTGSLGGSPVVGVTTLADCQTVCNYNTTCLGFDFNSQGTPQKCFLQTRSTYTDYTYQSTSLVQYRLVRRCM